MESKSRYGTDCCSPTRLMENNRIEKVREAGGGGRDECVCVYVSACVVVTFDSRPMVSSSNSSIRV